jgi:coenzyme F420-reducing hydrogenase gamma subunit
VAAASKRPKLAVFKFASCDGCQLSLLDCEDELLTLADAVQIANFAEASSAVVRGRYDVTLVEGSITTPHDAERIQQIRAASRVLVTIGACATAGGIQALRNGRDVKEFSRIVYARPEYIDTLATSTPIAAHVKVDFELRGCPIDKRQLLEVISALLAKRKPAVAAHSVCIDCKIRGNVCVMVAHGTACLGPVTHAGCGALCPSYHRGCYGCFGPAETTNTKSLESALLLSGKSHADIARLYATFNTAAPEFARAQEEQFVKIRPKEAPRG